jgi:hypothetical protein
MAKAEVGKEQIGTVGITFAIYKEPAEGAPLWMETQNVQLDEQGRYTVLLGATKSEGLPVELFAAAEPRWLGVQVNLPREAEQPRVLLVSVPYALKAADAETLGGMPASAFVLAAPSSTASGTSVLGSTTQASENSKTPGKAAASGKAAAPAAPIAASFIPVFTNSSGALGSSVLFQDASGNIGLGRTPVQTLDVNGGIRGTGLATGGRNVAADAINTNALFLNGSNAMGVIGTSNAAFAPGVLFTKTSFYSGGVERMTIDGTTGNVGIGTTTPAAKLDINGNQNIVGNVNVSGNLALPNTTSGSVGVVTLGGAPFLHNFGTNNTFLGVSAGNFTMTGTANTASGALALSANTTGFNNNANGAFALASNTTGMHNTASGPNALTSNTTGSSNTAEGAGSLGGNTTGSGNTANGHVALNFNTTGSNNTAIGFQAGQTANPNLTGSNNTFIGFNAGPGTPTQLTNAAAIGASALVNCNNCIVLGDSTMPMSVGIRTNSPGQALSVAGTIESTSGGFKFPNGTVQTTAAAGGGGTVTSITAGAGLSATPANPITTSGTVGIGTGGVTNSMLANSSITVNAGTGLTGGGAVTLGNSLTLSNTGVLSFNGRPGLVTPTSGDYSFPQISGTATSAQLPAASLVRAITYLAGCDSCSLLTTADSQNTIFLNLIGSMTINSVTCFSDAGAPTVNIQLNHGGTLTNILSANLTCSATGATSSSFSTSVLSLNDSLNFIMATADGVAKRVTLVIKATVN